MMSTQQFYVNSTYFEHIQGKSNVEKQKKNVAGKAYQRAKKENCLLTRPVLCDLE